MVALDKASCLQESKGQACNTLHFVAQHLLAMVFNQLAMPPTAQGVII